MCASCGTPAAFKADSNAGHIALIPTSFSAYWMSSGALIFATLAVSAAAP